MKDENCCLKKWKDSLLHKSRRGLKVLNVLNDSVINQSSGAVFYTTNKVTLTITVSSCPREEFKLKKRNDGPFMFAACGLVKQ